MLVWLLCSSTVYNIYLSKWTFNAKINIKKLIFLCLCCKTLQSSKHRQRLLTTAAFLNFLNSFCPFHFTAPSVSTSYFKCQCFLPLIYPWCHIYSFPLDASIQMNIRKTERSWNCSLITKLQKCSLSKSMTYLRFSHTRKIKLTWTRILTYLRNWLA